MRENILDGMLTKHAELLGNQKHFNYPKHLMASVASQSSRPFEP